MPPADPSFRATNLDNGITHSYGQLALEGATGYGDGYHAEGFVPRRRIVWTKSREWKNLWIGTVNGTTVFTCECDDSNDRPWFVHNRNGIPHKQGTGHPTQADAEASAEEALTAFVTSLGAAFPKGS